jgi:hypothetical protein
VNHLRKLSVRIGPNNKKRLCSERCCSDKPLTICPEAQEAYPTRHNHSDLSGAEAPDKDAVAFLLRPTLPRKGYAIFSWSYGIVRVPDKQKLPSTGHTPTVLLATVDSIDVQTIRKVPGFTGKGENFLKNCDLPRPGGNFKTVHNLRFEVHHDGQARNMVKYCNVCVPTVSHNERGRRCPWFCPTLCFQESGEMLSSVRNRFAFFLVFACLLRPAAAVPVKSAPVKLVGLRLDPPQITLARPLASQRLVVTGRYSDGSERDLTSQAHFRLPKPNIARLEAKNTLVAVHDGTADLIAQVGKRTSRAALHVFNSHRPSPVSFSNDLAPIFTKIGCNQGSCHGQQNGQGGFKLSLRGWDPAADVEQIVKADKGRRIDAKEPEKSLLLLKPTMQVAHGGGPRLRKGSPEYNLLLRWIQEGLNGPDERSPRLARIVVTPGERVLTQPGQSQHLLVTARFTDGTTRDVTALARYQSQNDAVAGVDEQGLVTARQCGESAIMVSYGGDVKAANILVPYPVLEDRSTAGRPAKTAPTKAAVTPPSYIDSLVARKLALLRLQTSGRSTDSEFLRRSYLDVIATLPTPEETRAFLSDRAPKKRSKLIDRLLERPEYIDFRTLKLADLLRVNSQYLSEEGADVYARWIHDRVQKNVAYDQFVRELLTGRGSNFHSGPANYFRVATDPQELAETTAQSFLGVRIQCAKCHNHPFERWKQQDYYGLAAFFARVGRKGGPEFGEDQVFVRRDGEVENPRTKKAVAAKFLDNTEPKLDEDADRREVLANGITSRENPDFARVAVNRIWAEYFGKGIVDAVDDFRVSNPPSNGPLLDALARDFVAHNFDVKYITRVILNSDTYQRSSEILPGNARDTRYFARAYPRRLPAETLMDAIGAVTGKPDRFGAYPAGWRAIQVRDSRINAYFLEVFGRPKREVLCACERSMQPNLAQSLHLINSSSLNAKIAADDGRLALLLKQYAILPTPYADRRILEELYLETLCRYPTKEETQKLLAYLAKSKDRRKGFEDALWALINAEEFLFSK